MIIEKDFWPNKKVELEFKGFTYRNETYFKPQLIFARNGMGKTTLANEIDEKSNIDENESIFYNSNNQPYQITNGDVIYTLKIGDNYRFTSIEDNAIFIFDDYIAENVNIIDNEINRLYNDLKTSVEFLLKRGGSRKAPDSMLVRELPRLFDVNVGSFNKGKGKLNLYASPIEILKKISKIDVFDEGNVNEKQTIYNKLRNAIDSVLQSEKLKLQRDFIDELIEDHSLSEALSNSLNKELTTRERISRLPEFITYFENTLLLLEDLKKYFLEQITEEYSNRLNKEFSAIFFSSERLRIDSKGSILSRDEPVPFTKLSTAEKNIVILVHSFLELEEMIKGKEIESLLVVIDDPISSTDSSNKVGLYTFFRNKFESLINIYRETQFIIFTHDEEVYYHFHKIFDDLKFREKHIQSLELTYKGIIERGSKYNFYRQQINNIYKYALGLEPELSPYIGNTMRRVLEAYSTFNYGLGPSEIATNQEILLKIQDEDEREFFKAYMYRLMLDSDSHTSDRFKCSSPNFSEMFSDEEKTRTAQLLLGLLYRLDSVHIERMIDSEGLKKEITEDNQLESLDEVGSKIEMWLKSIK